MTEAAVVSSDLSTLRSLLAGGASPDTYNDEGFCLVHLAITRRAKQEVLEILLAAGANIEATCKSSIYEGYRPLHFAAHEKSASTVRLLLKAGATCAPVSTSSETPLHVSCMSDWDPEVARQLLEQGAPLDPATVSGYTPLMLAATHEKRRLCEFLVSKGADANKVDMNGDTALHHAFHAQLQVLFGSNYPVGQSALEIAYFLVLRGADPGVKNKGGARALDYAMPEFAALIEGVMKLPNRNAAPASLEALMSMQESSLAAIGPQLPGLVKAMHGGIAERIAEEEARGPCPFINAKKSKKKPLTDGNSALVQDRELADAAKNATPQEVALCPFLREKQNASSAATVAEATAAAGAGKASANAAPVANIAEATGAEVGNAGKCPIPFHRELSSPTLWMGLTALVIGMSIGLALRGIPRPS
jgi:hypothetical protein